MSSRSLVLILGLLSTTVLVAADSTQQASIPFANNGGIRNWKADRDQGLWIQDSRGQWYYTQFLGGTCRGLSFAVTLGFDTLPTGTLDRTSSIVVPREGRCPIASLTKSAGPDKRDKAENDDPLGG